MYQWLILSQGYISQKHAQQQGIITKQTQDFFFLYLLIPMPPNNQNINLCVFIETFQKLTKIFDYFCTN